LPVEGTLSQGSAQSGDIGFLKQLAPAIGVKVRVLLDEFLQRPARDAQ